MSQLLPVDQVHANPDQPRKLFDAEALQDLAASIQAQGLIEPVVVRKAGRKSYVIIAGERRWRAHKIAGLTEIKCEIIDADEKRADELAIIENLQRADLTPLEEAEAFKAMMDRHGYTMEELAAALGLKQPHRIRDRLDLLKLQPGYRQLLRAGQIKPSEATEMARLSDRGQDRLFDAIKRGQCGSYHSLRAVADGLAKAETQTVLFSEEDAPAANAEDAEAATRFERKVAQVVALLNGGIRDNEIIAVHKVNPGRAHTIADQLAAAQRDLRAIEKALRETAAQADFLSA